MVDIMAENKDKDGMAELISLIQMSTLPIICTCADPKQPKLGSLDGHCLDLRFALPKNIYVTRNDDRPILSFKSDSSQLFATNFRKTQPKKTIQDFKLFGTQLLEKSVQKIRPQNCKYL